MGVCNLIRTINEKCKHIQRGEIELYFDNKTIHKRCYKIIDKESQCVNKAGATVQGIRNEIDKSPITITLKYSNDKPRSNRTFRQDLGPVLVQECDRKSREHCENLNEHSGEYIPYIAPTTPMLNEMIIDKSVQTMIREIDAKKHEEEYAKKKFKERWC